jgi:hypothetical protein
MITASGLMVSSTPLTLATYESCSPKSVVSVITEDIITPYVVYQPILTTRIERIINKTTRATVN